MGSDDNKHDEEDVSQVARSAQDVDDFEDEGYTIGDDPDLGAEVMEAEEVYEDQQEDVYEGDEEGPDGDDFADDVSADNKKKKLFAPALVLVIALGIGAYILMNPIGGGKVAPAVQQQPAPQIPVTADSMLPPAIEQTAEIIPPAMPDEAMPPQPVALEQAEQDGAVPPQQAGWNGFDDQSGMAAKQSETAPTATATATADITEDLGAPPVVSVPEVEIVGIPAGEGTPSLSKAGEVTAVAPVVAAPVAGVPAVELPVANDSAMPAFPAVPENDFSAEALDAVPQVDEFPKVAADANKSGDVDLPGVQGSGAEEGVVGKGAPATQSAPLTPMEEKPAVAVVPDANNYYDSRLTVPTNQAAKDTGPRKVDPTVEPGSRFVVVNKTHSSQSQESLMISASRALKLGRYEAAIEMYDSLYSRNSKDPAILLGRAVAYQKAGRTDTALKVYDELLAVDKNNESALLNMLGLLREQYPEVALRRLMNLHEQYPANAGISAQIGLTQADLGHYDDALRYLGMAASIEPRNAMHIFNMGVIADRKGDKAQAIKLYEQALEVDAVYGGGRSIQREIIYDRLSVLRRG